MWIESANHSAISTEVVSVVKESTALTQVPFAKKVFDALYKMHGVKFTIPQNALYATATGAALSYLKKHGRK